MLCFLTGFCERGLCQRYSKGIGNGYLVRFFPVVWSRDKDGVKPSSFCLYHEQRKPEGDVAMRKRFYRSGYRGRSVINMIKWLFRIGQRRKDKADFDKIDLIF